MSSSVSLKQCRLPSVGFNLGAIALAVGLTVIALAYGLEAYIGALFPQAPSKTVARTIVGKKLAIPAAWLREPAGSAQGFAARIALEIPLPLGRKGAATPIGVTLMPASQARPSALLIDGVYLHEFLPNELEGPPGLIGKPLYGSDGYENETVWYDPLSADPFVAKCIAPVSGAAGSRCLRTVYLATGIAAVYSFDGAVLWSWRSFDGAMGRALASIGF